MRTTVLEATDPRWHDILSHIKHDVYHTAEYAALDADRTECTAEAITATDGTRTIFLPYLVRSWGTSLVGALDAVSPYGYPGPIVDDGDPTFVAAAMSAVRSSFIERGICSAFLRCHPLIGPNLADIPIDGTKTSSSKTVFVDLGMTEKEFWTTTRKGHQSTINKCLRSGQKFHVLPYRECRADFLEIYGQTMEQAEADHSYLFDATYFDTLSHLEGAHWAVVELDSKIIASCLLFEHGGIVQAHLGGTRSDSRRLSPFTLLLHETRLWARARGNERLHLGGGVGGAQDSVFSFKAGFSRVFSDYVTLRMVIDHGRYAELVRLRAEQLGVVPELVRDSGFFPAYRFRP